MSESERLQRFKEQHRKFDDPDYCYKVDEELHDRLILLLNHPEIDKYCLVDAYYYDFSVIPHEIQQSYGFWRDVYLIYGITTKGEMITKWVDRWDLDSSDPIVDGYVLHKEMKGSSTTSVPPKIIQKFNSSLLSTPSVTMKFKRINVK